MSRSPRRAILVALALLLPATGAPAQLIQIKTVPVAQGDQFDLFPSRNLAMGGVSIAVDDPWLDPFVNPAKGSRLKGGRVDGAPTMFSVSNDAGGGKTLPVSVLATAGRWFGGLALALQEIDGARDVISVDQFGGGFRPDELSTVEPPFPAPSRHSHGNRFAYGMLGRPLGDGSWSLGGSLQWAELNAIDGVEFLYARSVDLAQFGHLVDARLGLLKQWEGERSLEAMLLHNRFDMAHDVTYLDWFWDPDLRRTVPRPRVEHNTDRTLTWGAHVEYEQPLPGAGWRGGARLTANVASHPKIPNYEIMNIPRDPGRSHAYNIGLGVSRVFEGTTFGVDAIFEPIRSHTWADAAAPIETAAGDTLSAGARTIENWFQFANAMLRFGLTEERHVVDSETVFALQFGLALRAVSYRLKQVDHVQQTERTQREYWNEWMPTWGLRMEMPRLTIGYRGSVTSGTGRPGVGGPVGVRDAVALAESNVLIAPSGPLTLGKVNVVSHQISISLPIR
jgi:hypothetical protein